MKDMIYRFSVLLVILILFNMTHLEGNQKDQEIIGLYQLGHPATSSYAHKILTLNPISFGENDEYQFQEEKRMKEPQWESFQVMLPNGIKLERSGKLKEKHGEFEGKKYTFFAKNFEKPGESKESLAETQPEATTDQANETSTEKTNEKKKIGFNFKNYLRAIIGYEQSAASSLDRKQGLFVDLYFNFPILKNRAEEDNWLKSKITFWGNIRLTSAPFNIDSNIAEFSTGFGNKIKEVRINQIAQAVEFQGGLEFRLSKYEENKKNGLYFIFGGNATSPISAEESIEIFEISDDVKAEFPDEDYEAKEYVALVPPSRDKFFRQYYFGFRLKSNFTKKTQSESWFPATLDFVYGWKDTGTEGIVKGFFKLEAFVPFRVGDDTNIYIFATLILKATKTRFSDHLFLKSAPEEITYPSANILKITIQEIHRDYYKIGIGVDVLSLF